MTNQMRALIGRHVPTFRMEDQKKFTIHCIERSQLMAPLHVEEQPLPTRDDVAVEDEELSDEQIQTLLKQAEARLRERATTAAQSAFTLPKFPRLNAGDIAQPYVRTDGEVARVDSSKLLNERERELANKIRKVEDPVAVKKKLLEVGSHASLIFAHEEDIPNFFLEQTPVPFWAPTCIAESLFYIVTLRQISITSWFFVSVRGSTLTLLMQEKKATAGPSWYNLPRTDLTPELKRDLQLLKMRNTLDPHRHYKKENSKAKAPEFSQVSPPQKLH